MLSELHTFFKLIWQKKKLLWLQIVKIYFLQCGQTQILVIWYC